ncbi:pyrroline-5-carboxylate reductase [Halobacillus sp. ACCC02827]|uniref:pyrroline-5-carboxylate reductase n=1 Tax=Bacillaceae TaxID=186817 RepID=UPI0002A51988|nr:MULTISPECIES: pyrroline-5-carboxylate reductase [Bacillaceae]ELK47576.1 pyrroline-5-carboxylate reductase [Halobacillus sp. BAB-2008]QHT45892.1 pyrroline-5-carboxylate reductase [Bacillus sp. SB49]WJE16698.1 pyrroline-5-carboxylate reductase [Halobacillus sp. ACCC02827]
MNKRIGFIGCGQMGRAMIQGMIDAGLVQAEEIAATALSDETIDFVTDEYGIQINHDNKQLARECDLLFLAIKPYVYEDVIKEIKDDVPADTVVVTIAAGITLQAMRDAFGRDVKVIRSMPNTPSLVGAGMSALCPNELVSKEELADVMEVFESFGEAEIVPEKLMDAVPSVSGSAPAFIYMLIEAMADAAVAQGFPRDKAYKMVTQTVEGSARMVRETGKHPGELKDAVCTPGGTTIAGVTKLEEAGLRNAIIQGMYACTEKSKELSKGK